MLKNEITKPQQAAWLISYMACSVSLAASDLLPLDAADEADEAERTRTYWRGEYQTAHALLCTVAPCLAARQLPFALALAKETALQQGGAPAANRLTCPTANHLNTLQLCQSTKHT